MATNQVGETTVDAIVNCVQNSAIHTDLRERFRQREIEYTPYYWRNAWPDHLGFMPDVFDDPAGEVVAAEKPKRTITRLDVFDKAKDLSDDQRILSFYAAVCAWGAGKSGTLRHRVMKPIASAEGARKLCDAIACVAEMDSPQDAYRFFNNAAQGSGRRVPYLGAAYFTKVLYFLADVPEPGQGEYKLILDARVARALGWSKKGAWKTAEYCAYLDAVDRVLKEHFPNLPADAVEYALFVKGGQDEGQKPQS